LRASTGTTKHGGFHHVRQACDGLHEEDIDSSGRQTEGAGVAVSAGEGLLQLIRSGVGQSVELALIALGEEYDRCCSEVLNGKGRYGSAGEPVGAGIAYPQSTATAAFNGDYGFSFTQELSAASENDGTAQLHVNSTTTPASSSGITDVNLDFGATQEQPFTGTFSAPTATGPFPGTLVGTNNATVSSLAFTPQIAVDYYYIDPGHGFFVETDLVNSVAPTTPPTPSGQVSFGYYAARTPVCTGCP